jgi:hypothetical protein
MMRHIFTFAPLAILACATLSCTQNTPEFDDSNLFLMAAPRAGVPISFEQIGENRVPQSDGTFAIRVQTEKVYRDSAGRVRIERKIEEPKVKTTSKEPGDFSQLQIIDPVAGVEIMLLNLGGQKTASRFHCQKIDHPQSDMDQLMAYAIRCRPTGEGRFFQEAGDEVEGLRDEVTRGRKTATQEPASKAGTSSIKIEDIASRVIAGSTFDGSKAIWTLSGNSTAVWTKTITQWYSKDLKLFAHEYHDDPNSSTHGRSTAAFHIRNLRVGEPDPKLFSMTIPPEYKIYDVPIAIAESQ